MSPHLFRFAAIPVSVVKFAACRFEIVSYCNTHINPILTGSNNDVL